MPLIKSASEDAKSENIRRELAAGKPRKQAIAIALDVARRAKRDTGGAVEKDKIQELLEQTDKLLESLPRSEKYRLGIRQLKRAFHEALGIDHVPSYERHDDGPTYQEQSRRNAEGNWSARDFKTLEGQMNRELHGQQWEMGRTGSQPYRIATPQPYEMAEGGGVGGGSVSQSVPWYTRQQAYQVRSQGLLKSKVPGRTDKLPVGMKSGSYVVPADIVSGLGQGNTDAGANILAQMFSRGPFGMKPMRGPKLKIGSPSRRGTGRLTKGAKINVKAFGGATEQDVPVLAAGGEYVVSPEEVAAIGGGDVDRGHKVLDKFVTHSRKELIKTLKKLPGPVKG